MEEVVAKAKDNFGMYGKKTILFVDEIHRFNKGQQDYLLPFVEDGTLVLIGATTENPYFEVNGALISRSAIFELRPLEKEDIKQILNYAECDDQTGLTPGKLLQGQFMDTYAKILADKIRAATGEEKPLDGFRIVVDAGNGAGGFYVDKVLKPLGANTDGSRYLDPDGSFPNHIPNPEDKTAMASITAIRIFIPLCPPR